jgi:hypothetical protein
MDQAGEDIAGVAGRGTGYPGSDSKDGVVDVRGGDATVVVTGIVEAGFEDQGGGLTDEGPKGAVRQGVDDFFPGRAVDEGVRVRDGLRVGGGHGRYVITSTQDYQATLEGRLTNHGLLGMDRGWTTGVVMEVTVAGLAGAGTVMGAALRASQAYVLR